MKTLIAQLAAVDEMESDDFDRILKLIQEDIGIDDGGYAGQYFSASEKDKWREASHEERAEQILIYIENEVDFKESDWGNY